MPLRYLGLVALLALSSPFIGYWSWNHVEGRRVAGRIAAIERAGEPVRIDPDASDKPVTAEQRRASQLYSEATRLMAAANGRQLLDAGALISSLSVLAAPDAARDPRAGQLAAIEHEYARMLSLLDEATLLDARGYTPGEQPKYPLEEQRLASPNAMRIARLAMAGESEAAARALLASLRIRRMFPPFYRGNALPTAHSLQLALSSGPVSAPLLERLQQEYVALDRDLDIEPRLLDDRARFLGWLPSGDVPGLSPAGEVRVARPAPFEALAFRLLRPVRRHSLVAALDDYAEAIEVAREPWPAKLDAAERLTRQKRTTRTARRSTLQQAGAPWGPNVGTAAMTAIVSRAADALARARAATVVIAVARYRIDHAGVPPPDLEALVPGYLAAVPGDPFSGQPMRFSATGSTYVAYSVGANRKDDGGRWYLTSDLLPRRGNPEDLGIAVRYAAAHVLPSARRAGDN